MEDAGGVEGEIGIKKVKGGTKIRGICYILHVVKVPREIVKGVSEITW